MEVVVKLPSVERFPTRRDWETACWKKIAASPQLLDLVVTGNERHHLILRAAVASRIAEGKRPRAISKELFLTRQTIQAIRKAMQGSAYRSYRERGKTERKWGSRSKKSPVEHRVSGRLVKTKYGTVRVP